MPTLGGWHLGINRFSQHPELAWQLVAFLTSTEAQRRLAVEGGLKPTRISVYQDPALVSGDPSLGFFFPLVQAARPRPVTPFYLMLSQVLQGELSAAVTGIKPAVTCRIIWRSICNIIWRKVGVGQFRSPHSP